MNRLTNIIEEMDLFFPREQCGTDTVYGCVSPSLQTSSAVSQRLSHTRTTPHLIVESALLIKILEELHVRFATPQIHVTDLKVAPD